MHFTFYLGDNGRLGLNLQFKSDVKSGLRVASNDQPNYHNLRNCMQSMSIALHSLYRI